MCVRVLTRSIYFKQHMLRGETGIYYEDLYPLICYLPRYASHSRSADDVLPLWMASDIGAQTTPTIPIAMPQVLSPVPSEPDLHEKDGTVVGSTIRSNSLPLSEASMDEKSQVHHHVHHHRKKSKHKFHVSSLLPEVVSDRNLLPARNPPKDDIYDYLPFLLLFKPLLWFFNYLLDKLRDPSKDQSGSLDPLPASASERTVRGKRRPPAYVESHVPLEITLFLSSYFSSLLNKGKLQPAVATGIMNSISSLQDSMSNLERIRTTPIPFAYQAHLRMTIW